MTQRRRCVKTFFLLHIYPQNSKQFNADRATCPRSWFIILRFARHHQPNPTNSTSLQIETASSRKTCFNGKANSTIVITLDKSENDFSSSHSREQKLTSDKVILNF